MITLHDFIPNLLGSYTRPASPMSAAAPASGGEAPGVGVALLRDVCARFQEACRRADDAGGAGLPHPLAPLAGKVLAALAGGDVGAAIEVLEQVARLAPPTDVRVRLPLEVLAATCRHAGAPEQLAVDAACVLVCRVLLPIPRGVRVPIIFTASPVPTFTATSWTLWR